MRPMCLWMHRSVCLVHYKFSEIQAEVQNLPFLKPLGICTEMIILLCRVTKHVCAQHVFLMIKTLMSVCRNIQFSYPHF